MGLTEALIEVIEFFIFAIFLGALYVSMWATLVLYYGNSGVFVFGALVLLVIGLIPLALVAAYFRRLMRKIGEDEDNDFRRFGGGGLGVQ